MAWHDKHLETWNIIFLYPTQLVAKNVHHAGQVRKDDDEEEGQSLHAKLLRYRYVRKIEARGVGEGVFGGWKFSQNAEGFETGNSLLLFFLEGGHGELTSGGPGHLQNSYEWFGTTVADSTNLCWKLICNNKQNVWNFDFDTTKNTIAACFCNLSMSQINFEFHHWQWILWVRSLSLQFTSLLPCTSLIL